MKCMYHTETHGVRTAPEWGCRLPSCRQHRWMKGCWTRWARNSATVPSKVQGCIAHPSDKPNQLLRTAIRPLTPQLTMGTPRPACSHISSAQYALQSWLRKRRFAIYRNIHTHLGLHSSSGVGRAACGCSGTLRIEAAVTTSTKAFSREDRGWVEQGDGLSEPWGVPGLHCTAPSKTFIPKPPALSRISTRITPHVQHPKSMRIYPFPNQPRHPHFCAH